jgi:putative ABC transport system ATP-binding protein
MSVSQPQLSGYNCSMLHVDSVTKSFGPRCVLKDVSLQLAAGEYVAIMGESGVGKSTLLNLIAGLDVPDSGRVSIEGRDLAALDDDERTRLRRARLGFVFQAFHLLAHLTIEKNVALPLALNGVKGADARERVEELLQAVGLADRRQAHPRELSGGEMQRVAIARALVHRPALVLADEPTGNLDAESAQHVLQLFAAQLERDRAACILVTHSEVAAATTHRILKLTARGIETAARR